MAHSQPDIDLHPAISAHVRGLGLGSSDDLRAFLYPSLRELPSPFLFKSMDSAARLTVEAIEANHDILIWGDYDVDGITGTSLLSLFFQDLGLMPMCYIPDRLTEGYGLNGAKLRELAAVMGANKLLITVDCGIADKEALLLARNYGFKTIVTDHHMAPDEIFGDAVINPKQPDCTFPYKDLSGVGVAFYLAAAVRSLLKEKKLSQADKIPNLKSFLGFVAFGTIADVMPLTGVNRLLTRGGFEAIAESDRHGLQTIMAAMDIGSASLTSEAISFQVAPSINAAGRLGEPMVPFKMFTAGKREKQRELARKLVSLNKKRKDLCRDNFDLARERLDRGEIERCGCIVVLGDFHEGVLGIIAARLAESYRVPSLVCCYDSRDRNTIKGSGRAPAGYDLYRSLAASERYLIRFGGHTAAAGFSVAAADFLEFKKHFGHSVSSDNSNLSKENNIIEREIIDLAVSEALNRQLLDNLQLLEPTGEGNPKPIFRDREVRFLSHSYLGHGRTHLKGMIRGTYTNVNVIGFNLGAKAAEIDLHAECGIIYTHSLEHYNGTAHWRVRLLDIWQGAGARGSGRF